MSYISSLWMRFGLSANTSAMQKKKKEHFSVETVVLKTLRVFFFFLFPSVPLYTDMSGEVMDES